jgi:glutathionylspermidine synthase
MRRIAQSPRPGWQARVEAVGLTFHTDRGSSDVGAGVETGSYWNDAAAHLFTPADADTLRAATLALHRLCIQAAHYVAERDDLLELFGTPVAWRRFVRGSLRRNDPPLYGRLDLAYDGAGPPQLLEYNADTPTSLIESAAAQWHWLADAHPEEDQFNLPHERLIARLRAIRTAARQPETAAPILHVSSVDNGGEDQQTALYVQDVAIQAGWDARFVALADVGWSERDQHFVGTHGERIRA